MKKWIVLLLCWASSVVFTDGIQQTFDVTPGELLQVVSEGGAVEVASTETNQVEVRISRGDDSLHSRWM
jgi:hypothetical protein